MVDVQPALERPWWALEWDRVADELDTNADAGLTAGEVARRLDAHGPNELEEEPGRPVWLMFLSQFANTMIVVLLIAAAITVVIGELKDAIVITAIVILNAVIGFVQERRAEQAMAALRTLAAPFARVLREGATVTVPARELVPGDVVLLETGDVVPADARLVECPNLRLNEAPLTGESVPVDKIADPLDESAGDLVADRHNMIFKGTSVTYGRGRALVVATGMNTALGRVAGLLKAHQAPRTPLQRRLAVLGRWLATAAVAVCLLVFAVGVLRGEDVLLMFLTAVSLAVAAIPEALPAVVTIALALGAQRMVRQHALIRKLPAVETLGSVTVICTDKTGTLTQGRMMVEQVWTAGREFEVTGHGYEPAGELLVDGRVVDPSGPLRDLVVVAALCNDAVLIAPSESGGEWEVAGDPTEAALVALAAKAGAQRDELHRRLPRIAEFPFDSERKRMTTLHRPSAGGPGLVATKGAVEAVLDVVTHVAAADGPVAAGGELRRQVLERAERYAEDGYRVLALAGRERTDEREDAFGAEHDLVLYGLVAMADPPRPESHEAVVACREAGITPVMITGDHPATARAIARRLGMVDDREVITGARLAQELDGSFSDRVDQIGVYARTTPEQKLDIVQAWKARGDIVAMTGDGVNDAPALRTADIGVAMGLSGTEVAKEAADMVLTDDNFATIVAAVREGRRIYDNIRRFVRYTLTSNSGEIWVMFLGPFFGLPLPLLPAQILWINLVTDGLPGLALGVEPAERGVMQRPPRRPTESIFSRGLWQHVIVVGLLMGLIPLALGIWAHATGRPWQTMVFTSLALLQLGHAMAVRSERESLRALRMSTNRPLLWAVAGTLLLQLVVVYWPAAQGLLDTEALDLFELLLVLAASTGVLWAVEAEKAWRRRRIPREKAAVSV